MQLIFLVESDKKSQSDYNYIKATIDHYYYILGVKLTPIFLGSKGNYNKKEAEIKRNINKYSKESIVFICYDIDNINNPSYQMNEQIISYANNKGYEVIWFYEDIEQVYIKQQIPNSEKTKRAIKFISHKEIKSINEIDLIQKEVLKKNSSNILFALDKYLKRK
ncbi:MAG: hypothetical protein IJS83_07180 [Acholeplasmatales bacterium]|nr:hypothetical protein [Acholeplasmatales bacterium]